MTQQNAPFAPVEILTPGADAWLLPDGTLYECASDQHDAAASWIVEHGLGYEQTKKIAQRSSALESLGAPTPPARKIMQDIGSLMVRGPRVLSSQDSVNNLTLAQLDAIHRNDLYAFDITTGESINTDLLERASEFLATRVEAIQHTSAYKVYARKAGEQYKHYSDNRYIPGVFPQQAWGDTALGTTESFHYFKQHPFGRNDGQIGNSHLYIGSSWDPIDDAPGKKLETKTLETLSQGYTASFKVEQRTTYLPNEYNPNGRSYGYVNFEVRFVPFEDRYIRISLRRYIHDGLSMGAIFDRTQTTISAEIVSEESMHVETEKIKKQEYTTKRNGVCYQNIVHVQGADGQE